MSDEITSPEDAEKAEIGIREREDAAYWRGLEESRPRWIPVTERLPEDEARVLVRCVDDHFVDCIYQPNGRRAADFGTPWIGPAGLPLVATHWSELPNLPEPPKP